MKSTRLWLLLGSLVAVAGPAIAQQPPIPVINADDSYVAQPPPAIEPGMKGYGTRGVDGRTLAEMLENCRDQARQLSAVEQARCEQLQRTLKNQPGNSADAS